MQANGNPESRRESFERHVRQQLADWREERGISQEWLGVQLGLDQGTVSKVESGRRRLSLYEYMRWSRALGIGADEAAMALIRLFDSQEDGSR